MIDRPSKDFVRKNIYTEIHYQNEEIIDIAWDCPKIGYGHLIVNKETKEVLDDEFMSKGFCEIVLEKTFD